MSEANSRSVGGRILIYASPFWMSSGISNPSGVEIHCFPPTLMDLSSTLTPNASIWMDERMVCPRPVLAAWLRTDVVHLVAIDTFNIDGTVSHEENTGVLSTNDAVGTTVDWLPIFTRSRRAHNRINYFMHASSVCDAIYSNLVLVGLCLVWGCLLGG